MRKLLFFFILIFLIVLPGRIYADDLLVSDIFFDTFILDALNDLSIQTGVPIVAGTAVSGFVTMELDNVPLEEALMRICHPLGFVFRYMEQGYYLVGTKDIEDPAYWMLSEVATIHPQYLKAEVVAGLLSTDFAKYVKVDRESNTIVVTAPNDILNRIKRDIKEIDVPVRQVVLEVLVTEISDDGRKALGTDWQWRTDANDHETPYGIFQFLTMSQLTSTLGYTFPDGIMQFLLSLRALTEKGDATILANPRITALTGKEANLFLGQEQGLIVLAEGPGDTVRRERITIRTGVTLNFLPHISEHGEVTLRVEPEVSSVSGYNPDGFPIVSTRRANTTVRVRDGETFVLAGLIQELSTERISRVPILGRIPLLGRLFRREEMETRETEVIIFITPHLVSHTGPYPTWEGRPRMEIEHPQKNVPQ